MNTVDFRNLVLNNFHERLDDHLDKFIIEHFSKEYDSFCEKYNKEEMRKFMRWQLQQKYPFTGNTTQAKVAPHNDVQNFAEVVVADFTSQLHDQVFCFIETEPELMKEFSALYLPKPEEDDDARAKKLHEMVNFQRIVLRKLCSRYQLSSIRENKAPQNRLIPFFVELKD